MCFKEPDNIHIRTVTHTECIYCRCGFTLSYLYPQESESFVFGQPLKGVETGMYVCFVQTHLARELHSMFKVEYVYLYTYV